MQLAEREILIVVASLVVHCSELRTVLLHHSSTRLAMYSSQ